jgi:hypothetical protein
VNLRLCYTALVAGGWVKSKELGALDAWLDALSAARGREDLDPR